MSVSGTLGSSITTKSVVPHSKYAFIVLYLEDHVPQIDHVGNCSGLHILPRREHLLPNAIEVFEKDLPFCTSSVVSQALESRSFTLSKSHLTYRDSPKVSQRVCPRREIGSTSLGQMQCSNPVMVPSVLRSSVKRLQKDLQDGVSRPEEVDRDSRCVLRRALKPPRFGGARRVRPPGTGGG